MDPAEPQLVLGTAGHIDHGKTALIRALTGVDTDRLPEEKARGITIDLGFAPLDLGDLRLGVVDVPGHEGLVRTMVSGATGIDLLLLVVAADEGVMPQTREHLAICELLGVARGVVALSKIDAVEADFADLAEAEVAEYLAGGPLAGSPIVRVSATSGAGLDELRAALLEAARAVAPRTPRSGPPRLAVDRCFSVRGFGAVVTGTLVGSALAVGDAVEVLPAGLRARVRGLQRHGRSADRIEAGTRCAVNLQGVEPRSLARGQVVTRPDALIPTRGLDVELHWLHGAPPLEKPASVELLLGTAERRARVAPIGATRIAPGERGYARIHVEGEALPTLPGDRFILRGFARSALTGATVGGGRVLDVAPPRRRRSDPALRRDLEALARHDPVTDLEVRIRRGGFAGAMHAELSRETGLDPAPLDAALASLSQTGRAARSTAERWLSAEALAELEARTEAALDDFHAREPLLPGMPAGALQGRLPENVPADAGALARARLAARGALRAEGDLLCRPAHRPALDAADQALAERILADSRRAGLEPSGLREWAERLGIARERLRELLAHLEREGKLVRTRGELWFDRAAIDALRQRVLAHLAEHGRLETLAYKALIGTTRRSAVPLMELFDEERVTLRRGDLRLPRRGS